MSAVPLSKAAALIAEAQSICHLCHVRPDGDALGSMLGLHHACVANAKRSWFGWGEPELAPEIYGLLPGIANNSAGHVTDTADLVITYDCGSIQRLGALASIAEEAYSRGRLIVIDHHVTNTRFGNLNLVDPSREATVVVVRELLDRLGWDLNRDVALCLFTGLITDTGSFRYSCTDEQTFELAAELAAFDLPIAELSRQVFAKHPFSYLQLVGQALSRMELDESRSFVYTWVTEAELVSRGLSYDNAESLIDVVRQTSEAEISCVVKVMNEVTHVSLRSVGELDVSEIAASLGGGGHVYAAGFSTPASLEDVISSLKAEIDRHR